MIDGCRDSKHNDILVYIFQGEVRLILRRLRRAWVGFDLTVEDGIRQLATICSMEVKVKGQKAHCQKIPRPRQQSRELLEALQIKLPEALPSRNLRVVTRKKLLSQRKTNKIKAFIAFLFFDLG